MTGGIRPATVDRIRTILQAHPGATIRGKRGEDGVTQYSIAGPTRLADLKRHARLTLLKARADTASATMEEQP